MRLRRETEPRYLICNICELYPATEAEYEQMVFVEYDRMIDDYHVVGTEVYCGACATAHNIPNPKEE